MSEHQVLIQWKRNAGVFDYKTFDRTHTWKFSGGQTLLGSSAPEYQGNPELANPEEGLIAALSSCHMLTFLAIAALKRFTVDSYEDVASGELAKNDKGKMMISKMVLRPKVVFGGDKEPDAETLATMHRKAHENCFVANSLATEVVVESR